MMENNFYQTIYDMYRSLGLSENEIDEYLSSIFNANPIDFSL